MGTVFKRGDSPVWYLSFVGASGRRKKISFGTKDTLKQKAKDELRDLESLVAQVRAGKLDPSDLAGMTVEQARQRLEDVGCTEEQIQPLVGALIAQREGDEKERLTIAGARDAWLKHAALKRSLSDDKQRLQRAVDFFGADRALATIRPEDVIAFRDHLLTISVSRKKKDDDARPTKKPAKPKTMKLATVNRHLAALRSAIHLAEERGHKTLRPTKGLELPDERNTRNRLATEDELVAILAKCPDELRVAVTVCRWTGARLGEIAAMTWDRVDLKAKTLRLEPKHTKSGEGRIVPMPPPAVAALDAWKKATADRRKPKDGEEPDERVFTTPRTTMSSTFAKICKRAGVKDLHIHDLRHLRLTELRRAGVDLFVLQAISGHRDLQMLKRYAKVSLEDMQAAVAKASGETTGGAK